MKIWTKIEWAIIGAASALLLLLLILFRYSQPHSDDFSYAMFVNQKGFWEASCYIFQNNTGRFLSSALLYLNPMKQTQMEGYNWYTGMLFLVFVISLFAFFRIILNRFAAPKNILILFSFVFLCFCTFTPDLHEFCFWLSGESTYLIACVFWLWAVVLHVLLLQEKYRSNVFLWLLCGVDAIALTGCSEAGIFLYLLVLFCSFLYRRQMKIHENRAFYSVVLIFIGATIWVFSAKGNLHRHSVTPFSGNLLLAVTGGFYAAGFWLSKWIMIFVPVVSFYLLSLGHSLLNWSAMVGAFKPFRAKTVFVASLIFFLLCQIAAVWMSGSTPEPRFENVLFLFLLFSFLFAAQLMMQEQAEFFGMLKGKLYRGFKTLSFIYIICVFMVVPNNFEYALFDVVTGTAHRFSNESKLCYEELTQNKDSVVALAPLSDRPKLLYVHTMSCQSQADMADVPAVAFAEYFGKKWIYEYPCNSNIPEYSIKEILKQKRQQFFSAEKK